DGYRDMTGQRLQDFDLGAREGVDIMVRSAERPDYPVAHLKWNDDFRTDVGLARTVKQLLAHIGRVVCLACRNNLRAQAFRYRPALALLRVAAAVDRREVELIAFDKQDAGFNAPEVHGHTVNDSVEQFVQFQDGTDFLRRLLQGQQHIDAALLKDSGRGADRDRTGSAH